MAPYSFLSVVASVALVALAPAYVAGAVVDLPEGEFYRPSGAEVSGFVNATTTYTRSPCPALNSLANHGILPRDGKNLTRALIKAVIMEHLNVDDTLSTTMVSQAPEGTFSLADLSKHNMIEHDVSFSRADWFFGADPALTTPAYMSQLLELAKPSLTLEKTAWLRAERIAECEAKNPNCTYGASQQLTANFQLSLMLRVLGGKNSEEISFEYLDAFFNKETIPKGYTKPSVTVTAEDVFATSDKITSVDTKSLDFASSGSKSGSSSSVGLPVVSPSTTPSPTESAAPGRVTAVVSAVAVLLVYAML